MKLCLLLLITLCSCFAASAQITNLGGTLLINPNGKVQSSTYIINQNGGLIQNDGTLIAGQVFRNCHEGELRCNGGIFEVGGNFVNSGRSFSEIKLRFVGPGATDSVDIGSGSSIDSLIISKEPGSLVRITNDIFITGGVMFDKNANYLVLDNHDVRIGSSGRFLKFGKDNFVITNSSGVLRKDSLGEIPFTFPIGFSQTEYNEITVSNSGVPDNVSARCLRHVPGEDSTESHFVDNSWELFEGTAGGSSFTLTTGWSQTDEPDGFLREKAGVIWKPVDGNWDLPASGIQAATGESYFTRTRGQINGGGLIAVGDLLHVNTAKIWLKMFLQGAGIDSSNGLWLMSDLLRDDPATPLIDPVIPIAQPYSGSLGTRFSRIGVYDGSSSVNEQIDASVLANSGQNAIVDWVYVSTMASWDPSVKLQTRAALLQRDGDIVDVDGFSPLKMPIDSSGGYFLMVNHRNHLGVRTNSAIQLRQDAITDFDFSSAGPNVYSNPALPNVPMVAVNGRNCLWAGNASGNSSVRYSTPGNDLASILISVGGVPTNAINGIYSPADLNMDRKVKFSGPSNDPSVLLGRVLGGVPTAIITEHL